MKNDFLLLFIVPYWNGYNKLQGQIIFWVTDYVEFCMKLSLFCQICVSAK